MNRTKLISVATMFLPLWFVLVYALVSLQRPDFRHFNMAVSEQGLKGAPNLWVWNVLGYLPGVLIFLFGVALKNNFQTTGKTSIPFVTLALSGLFMAMAECSQATLKTVGRLTMLLHTIGSFGSGFLFMISAFWLPSKFKQSAAWKWFYLPLLLIAAVMVLNAVFVTTGPMPGLGQRIGFACYFVWLALTGFNLMKTLRPPYLALDMAQVLNKI